MAEFDADSRKAISENVAKMRDASVEAARQMAIVWEARMNVALASGDSEMISRTIRDMTTMRYMDNCNCGSSFRQPTANLG